VPYVGAEEWVAQVTAERGWANDIAWSPWTVDGQVAGCESSNVVCQSPSRIVVV